jgi:GT2 family glycosyltransferase
MDPVSIDRTHILVLNFNGRDLLRECLPSILDAASRCSVDCPVTVVDNGSTDGSAEEVAQRWPGVAVMHCPNLGLASFNEVVRQLSAPSAILLNNDVKLDASSIDPLLAALDCNSDALFAAPQCWTFDGSTYEGMRTRVRMRYGFVQGRCRVPGFEQHIDQSGLTAAAGPVLAVHCGKFLELGGYDAVFRPGRVEDLDLGYRGWLRGWKGYYVPDSKAYHRGMATFVPELGASRCHHLDIRNTLLFAWKNLTGPRLWAHLAWLPARLLWAVGQGKREFMAALADACARLPETLRARRRLRSQVAHWNARQESFLQEFGW